MVLIEFDTAKTEANIAKHGIDMASATVSRWQLEVEERRS
jgi:uncharacterized DUF497 family protein